MSQSVLLTTLLFFDDNVLKPLHEELGILGIQQFTINLKNNWQKLVSNNESEIIAHTVSDQDYSEDTKERTKYRGKILDHLSGQIKKLKDCCTCSYTKDDFVSLDFWVDENTRSQIRKKFDNDPYKFFSVFQMLQALNERAEDISEKREIYNSRGYYTDYKRPEYSWFFYFTDYFIKQKDKVTGEISHLLLKQLSDGEQQFLHTLGICLMLQNKRTLLMLDEPETHFNPDWRSKFINVLRKTLEAGGDNFLLKDIVLTSHSPFIISDCLPDKVIVFEKGKKPKTAAEMDIETFGTSVNLLTNKIFKKKNTIGDYSLEKIEEYRNLAKNANANIEELIQDINSKLGDSLEKLLLIKEITNSKE